MRELRCDFFQLSVSLEGQSVETFRIIQPNGGDAVIVFINPNSAVAIDGKREVQSFRNEVDGFLLP